MDWLRRTAEKFIKDRKKTDRWHKIVMSFAITVVFITTYALVLPAITIDRETSENTPGMYMDGNSDVSSEDRTASVSIKNDGTGTIEIGDEVVALAEDPTANAPETTENKQKEPAPEKKKDKAEFSARASDNSFVVTVKGDTASRITRADSMHVKEITARDDLYKAYANTLNSKLNEDEDGEIRDIHIYDLQFFDQRGKYVHLQGNVKVTFSFSKGMQAEIEYDVRAFAGMTAGSADWLDASHVKVDRTGDLIHEIRYIIDKDGVSGFALVGKEKAAAQVPQVSVPHDSKLTASGDDYKVAVSYDDDAGIPDGAELHVKEIKEDNKEKKSHKNDKEDGKEYEECLGQTRDALSDLNDGQEVTSIDARFFDISIMDGDREIQPKSPVFVKIATSPVKVEDTDDIVAVDITEKEDADDKDDKDDKDSKDSGEKSDKKDKDEKESGKDQAESGKDQAESGEDEADKGAGDKASDQDDETGKEAEILDAQAKEGRKGVQSVEFETESLDVNGIVYSVTFNSEKSINLASIELEEGGAVSLKKAAKAIDLVDELNNAGLTETVYEDEKDFIENIDTVECSNPELVTVKHKTPVLSLIGDEDWTLKSLKAYDGAETLTITMSDGLVIAIPVIDKASRTKVLSCESGDYRVTLEYDDSSNIPDNAVLSVVEIPEDADNYQDYIKQAESALPEEKKISTAKFFDITILDGEGNKIEPDSQVRVKIDFEPMDVRSKDDIELIHFQEETGNTNPQLVEDVTVHKDKKQGVDGLEFSTDGFSVFGIVGTTIEKNVLASDGHNYKVSVTYGPEAGVPEGAELEVSEILQSEEENAVEGAMEYDTYLEKTKEALGMESGVFEYARFFDIKIVDENGEKVEIAAPVDVKIELADKESVEEAEDNTQVVHFADGSKSGDVVSITTEAAEAGQVVSFEAEGFSVYAIVTGPSGAEAGWQKLTSLDALTNKGYYIGYTSGYYLTNTTTSKTVNGASLSGIKRTGQKAVPTVNGAVLYYFENASDGKYYIYCMDGEDKKYVVNNGNASLSFAESESDKTAFTVEVNANGVFKIHNGDWYWNMQTGNNADGFYAKNQANHSNNNLYLWEQTDPNTDTYGLGGKTYGLMTWTGGKTAKALMAAENTGTDENNVPYSGCLEAKFLTVMTKETNAGNKLYVPNDTTDTVTKWTFEWVRNDPNNRLNSYYYLKADNGKYLKITANGLSLVDQPDNTCLIQAKPGTGNNEGQICLKSVGSGSKTLTYSGEYAKGYNIGGTAGSEWLYLVEEKPENLLSDYEKVYTATKVSVSDTEKVNTGAKIIIYARQWKNDHYEYYAINWKGELVPCIESGDTIEWYGGNVNDMLWQFTEYVYEGTDTPNGYYELENLYAREKGEPSYLAPKYSDGTFLSKDTVGVLLQGRTDKQYYSPIVAWDTPEYMYSALTVDLNQTDPVLEPVVRKDGLDFYFAIMEDLPVDDTLHTVPTVDNNDYGIVMKMADLTNGNTSQMPDGSMNKFLQSTTSNGATFVHTPGLLSTNLGNDGYPVTTRDNSGGSLGLLYASSNDYRTVNHLFIESTYRATGYYEYNSAQNFAYLTDDNDFRVYQELGTNDTTSKPTLQHGQFFPYNDIEAGRFASANPENLYEISGGTTASKPPQLSDSDPRKHEQMYLVKEKTKGEKTDYYFAMELEASFIQTPSGLDAWGHDIIFEFSGDDDFWLYVDGELVLDLGGIHSAVGGKVNFRTGVVINNGVETTLYDVFKANYITRGYTEDQALDKVNRLFEQNEAGQWVFKDDTKHTMRIFYMERGAGASNLHMKFNLASVKKGTVELKKKLEGVDETETTKALFPYQVYYRMENETSSNPERMLRNAFDPSKASGGYYEHFGPAESTNNVLYKDKDKPVTFMPEMTVDGVTYYNVFLLKPDETAVLNFPVTRPDPDGNVEITVGEYRIVECGIDSSVFTEVTVNDVVNAGTDAQSPQNRNLKDYGIDMATTDDRPKVNYVNKVETVKDLTFTKELYRKYGSDTAPVKVNPDGSEIGEGTPRTEQAADEEVFDFRLYLKTPYETGFSAASLHIYHVKDPEGYYCTWDSESKTFKRITSTEYPDYLDGNFPNGTKNYDDLTDDITDEDDNKIHRGKFWASFETGNASISGIPAYYTVEVRGLIPGTEYQLIERPTETPDGYKFWQYTNNESTVHTDPYNPGDGIEGTIRTDIDASAVVKNYKGFGLRLEKVWEDASSIQDRDPAYFAVYRVNSDGDPVDLVLGSVQKLAYNSDPKKQQLYWWYLDLPSSGTRLEDYAVFEVVLTGDGITVGNDGVVSGFDNIKPIYTDPEDGKDGLVTLHGTLVGESEAKEIVYTVTYEDPVNISDNVRGFKATNSPEALPPVRFVKTDWDGKKLSGADFSLRYGEDLANSLFDPATQTSDENGLIAQVYLQKDVEYTLTELKAPQGYVGLKDPLQVKLVATSDGWKLNVSPEIPSGYPTYYKVTTEDDILTLTVKNHPYDFEAVKVDSTNPDLKLAGAKFNLYKQVTVGQTSTWDDEHPVYTGLTTEADGIIPNINNTLPAGTYQLRETSAPSGYIELTGNIDFTVSELGVIILGSHPDGVNLTSTTDDSGKIKYSIAIPNKPKPIKLKKVDESNPPNPLKDAKFSLNKWNGEKNGNNLIFVEMTDPLTAYNDIDLTDTSEIDLSLLPVGTYQLEETEAPDGYVIDVKYHYFLIKDDRSVKLCDETGKEMKSPWKNATLSGNKTNGYVIAIKNISGVALPNAGGPGTNMLYLLGTILTAFAGIGLIMRKRRRDAA